VHSVSAIFASSSRRGRALDGVAPRDAVDKEVLLREPVDAGTRQPLSPFWDFVVFKRTRVHELVQLAAVEVDARVVGELFLLEDLQRARRLRAQRGAEGERKSLARLTQKGEFADAAFWKVERVRGRAKSEGARHGGLRCVSDGNVDVFGEFGEQRGARRQGQAVPD